MQDRGFDDSEVYISNNIQTSRPQDFAENNLLKSVAADKERANSVAKIKVVVRSSVNVYFISISQFVYPVCSLICNIPISCKRESPYIYACTYISYDMLF